MIPPLATLMGNTAAVTALLGSNPTRFFPSKHPENETLVKPYGTYLVVGGGPSDYLGDATGIDNSRIQIDIYGDTLASAKAAYAAVRDATETVSHIISFNIGGALDDETKLYRFSFDISYWLDRN